MFSVIFCSAVKLLTSVIFLVQLLFAGYDYSSTEVIEVPDPPNLTTAGVNIQVKLANILYFFN